LSFQKIGRIMKHTDGTISKYVKIYGLKRGIPKMTKEQIIFVKKVKELTNRGCGTRKIAEILNCSRGKVEYVVHPKYWADRKHKYFSYPAV